jgi:hypothetical protein
MADRQRPPEPALKCPLADDPESILNAVRADMAGLREDVTAQVNAIRGDVRAIDTAIRGDGTAPGLVGRVTALERAHAADQARSREDVARFRWLFTVIFGVASFIVSTVTAFVVAWLKR